ncbi:MAG: hypothetical protein GWP91_17940, partial [Rhodobacterales bacterium]|nr:hypothetical protein [Rhodobacterales bacterium]
TGADLGPWVDPGTATRAGMTVDAWATKEATRWGEGRRTTGVTDEHVGRFVDGCTVLVHAPGSRVARSIDILGGLQPPADSAQVDAIPDLASGTISALMDLVGESADPLRDPRHIVLSRILEDAWAAGEDFELERLVVRLVDPPFQKVGVFPLDQFLPRKDRMALAMQLNGLLASSSFEAWRTGPKLDFDALLAPVAGQTPIRVFSMSHLDDNERQFFASMFLHRFLAWTRRQSGSSALRAVLYLDEAFGFCPPHPARPATKKPLMHLIKQARAVGVGVILVSQNPVDIDYAVISNAGNWWLGRLATAQDRRRMLEGLDTAAQSTLTTALDGLAKRQFAVVQPGKTPWVLSVRWVISWMRGPMTLNDVARIAPPEEGVEAVAEVSADPDVGSDEPTPAPQGFPVRWLSPEVALSARYSELLGHRSQGPRSDGKTVWEPALYGKLQLKFDERNFVSERVEDRLFFPLDHEERFERLVDFSPGDLLRTQPPMGLYMPLPDHLDEASELKALQKRVVDRVLDGETDTLYVHAKLKLRSRGGETEAEFAERVKEAIQSLIDADAVKLKERADVKLERLETRNEKLARDLDRYQSEVKSKMANEVVNVGETLFGMFFGGRKKSFSTAMSKREQTKKAHERIERTEESVRDLERDIYELGVQTEDKLSEIENKHHRLADDVEARMVRLERSDLRLSDFGIVWIPVTRPL